MQINAEALSTAALGTAALVTSVESGWWVSRGVARRKLKQTWVARRGRPGLKPPGGDTGRRRFG